MSRLIRHFLNIFVLVLVLIFLNDSTAQGTKSHEIGKLWETMFMTGAIPEYAPLQNQMTYPGGDFRLMMKKNLAGLGVWIGVSNWTDTLDVFWGEYVCEGGFENYEASLFTFPISNKKRVRNRLPNVMVNGNLEGRYLDDRSNPKSSSIPADERIETIWATNVGVNVHMFSYALANHNHNSYIIREYTFTNDGIPNNDNIVTLPGQDLTGVYFGFQYYLLPGGDRGHEMVRQHDDWAVYYGNQPGDTLRGLFYMYDDDADDNYYQGDDIGDPDRNTGELLSPQYPGIGVLHADADWDDDSDDRNQPSTVYIDPRDNMHSYTKGHTALDLYADLSSGQQSQGTVGRSANPYDPTVRQPVALLSFGPYDIPFGESVTIVLYEAVGSISQELAIEAGRDWLDLTISDAEKNALVASGKDSLFRHASHAEYAWQIGLDSIPSPPPAPDDVFINSGPGKIDLEWGSVADKTDWMTGELDLVGYRIYRTEGLYTNVYRMIAEFPGDTTHYTDREVERGKEYYYFITAFDDGTQNTTGVIPGQSLESSRYYNRNFGVGAAPFRASSTNLDSIYVVPNPYHVQGLTYGGTIIEDYHAVPRIEDKLSFVGLPAKAIIRIFTMHGDLVSTLPHPNPENPNSVPESADEEWHQITESWQTIKSGVYIYHVEGWDLDGTPLGSTTGKFVIIR